MSDNIQLSDMIVSPGAPTRTALVLTPVTASAAQSGDPLVNAIRQNVLNNVAALKSATPILTEAVTAEKLKVVGGVYHLTDGRVEIVA